MAVLALAFSCNPGDHPREGSRGTGFFEASMNFDLATLGPFLHRVSSLVEEGFGEPEIARITAEAAGLAVGSERQWRFPVVHRGRSTTLRVQVFMDDREAPDLAFFTSADLAGAIEQEMMKFIEELGL